MLALPMLPTFFTSRGGMWCQKDSDNTQHFESRLYLGYVLNDWN